MKGEAAMATVKTIGSSGQISLGKEHAGRQVLVEEVEPGCWVVKLGRFVPDSERWLHEARVEKALDEAIAWAEQHPAEASDLDGLELRIRR
jgi:hypothetical protein